MRAERGVSHAFVCGNQVIYHWYNEVDITSFAAKVATMRECLPSERDVDKRETVNDNLILYLLSSLVNVSNIHFLQQPGKLL